MDPKELKALLESINSNWQQFKEDDSQHKQQLTDRLDQLEGQLDTIGMLGTTQQRSKSRPYGTLFTDGGQKAFVVGKGQQLSDIPDLREKTEISLDRWVNALLFGSDCGDKEAIEFLEETKATTTGSTGVLIPAGFVAEWVDMMRAQSILFRAGAKTVTMPEGTLTYSHQTADPTAVWRSTEGASLSAGDPTFASRVLTAKTLAVRTQVSLEASQDIPGFGEQITRAYTKALAAAIDSAGFIGSSPEPTGIHNISGVSKVAAVGTPTNWDEVIDGVAAFLNANNPLETLTGIVTHPNIWKVFAKLKTGITSDNTSLELPPSIKDVPQFVSTGADEVVSPESYHITLGNFEDLVVGIRLNPTIRILDATTSMANNLLVEIIGVARVDILALRPASFVVLEDVTT